MKDLYEREQEILDQALQYLKLTKDETQCDRELFAALVKEYRLLLKMAKRITMVTDKTAVELNADKLRLLDKVQYDGLTGIYNRQYFEDEFRNAVKSCVDTGEMLGVLMLDVDFFKQFNDTYGHTAGDECLRKIAKTLEESVLEKVGFAARYGGEEFIIVLPGTDEGEVSKVAETILHNIRALHIPHEKNADRGVVTISIGVACVARVVELDKEAYVNCADAALYRSKQTGRDRFTLQRFEEDIK